MDAAVAIDPSTDLAFRVRGTAFDDGFPCYPWFEQDPMLEPIRTDARYQNLMRELRVQFEATRSRYETWTD